MLVVGIFCIALILNMRVTFYQGVNGEVKLKQTPLYLKTLGFLYRHYNYQELAKEITKNCKTDKEKVFCIFEWTYNNLKHASGLELPVIDDHVYNIIIRGYGSDDQLADVFTTLCNYAKIKSFFVIIKKPSIGRVKSFCFVKVDGKWNLFDAYNGVYFAEKIYSELATLEEIRKGDYKINQIMNLDTSKIAYDDYIEDVLRINPEESHKWSRANIQSPFNRLIYGLKVKFLE